MSQFYRFSGRCAAVMAIATLTGFSFSNVSAQIAFPSGVHVRAVEFITESGSEVQLVGTHSFGVYKSVPGAFGQFRWEAATSGLSNPLIVNDLELLASGTVLMGAAGSGGQQTNTNATGLFKSKDGGTTWKIIEKSAFDTLAVHTVNAIAESTVDNLIYLSADDGNVFFSQDDGVSWTFNGRLPRGASDTPWSLVAHPSLANRVYAGTFGRGVFASSDNGGYWDEFTDNASLTDTTGASTGTAVGGGYVFDLEFNPADGNDLYAATSSGVWRFADVTDLECEWARVAAADSSFTLTDGTTINAHPQVRSIAFDNAGTTLYMATWGFGVLTTTDFTGTPTPTQLALRGQQVSVVAVSPSGAVFAGSTEGVYQIAASSSTALDPGNDVPESYALNQNYPNPFNPSTSISFDLPERAEVSLAVFDMLGKKVLDLTQGTYAAGSHAVSFDASRLHSGLYIYRLDAGGRVFSRSMTLIK